MSTTRVIPRGREELSRAMQAARSLCDRFTRYYGSILRPQIQTRLFGRSFNLQDPLDCEEFEKAGAHTDPAKCMGVVGNAARWTMEALMEAGVLTL